MNKYAVYTGTRNLYTHMVPAIKSLLANSDVDKIYLLIEDDEFPYELPEGLVETKNLSGQTWFGPECKNSKSSFTYMAMIRVCFAKIFPDLDKILSLDVDTFAVRDASDVWNLPIDGRYFSASVEVDRSQKEKRTYTNAGVMLQNLKKIREDKLDDFFIHELNTRVYPFLDQDVFNIFCQGKIQEMPCEYNSNEYTSIAKNPRIVHYAGIRKWDDKPEYTLYNSLPWDTVLEFRKMRYGR